jgi:hypothetical protein
MLGMVLFSFVGGIAQGQYNTAKAVNLQTPSPPESKFSSAIAG